MFVANKFIYKCCFIAAVLKSCPFDSLIGLIWIRFDASIPDSSLFCLSLLSSEYRKFIIVGIFFCLRFPPRRFRLVFLVVRVWVLDWGNHQWI